MKVLGIAAEYNPFHNGHLLHLSKARELTGSEYALAVMSGNFTQRGEPALLNKWVRTEMALKNGIDLVIELPFVYATRNAGFFAAAAVEIMEKSGIVTHLCFGSESGNIKSLKNLAKTLADEPYELKKLIKTEMSAGITLPSALTNALAIYLKKDKAKIAQLIKTPNNVLGLEYLKALHRLKSNIQPVTFERILAGHHDPAINKNVASSTAIRHFIHSHGLDTGYLKQVLPNTSVEIIQAELQKGRGPVFYESLTLPLLIRLRTIDNFTLAKISDMSEGLENRIISKALDSTNLEDLISGIKSKRYTRTRIQRLLLHSLMSFTREDALLLDETGPQYIRILGFNDKGRYLLNKMKDAASLPLVLKVAEARKISTAAKLSLDYETRATDLYTALYPNSEMRLGRQDFLQGPVRL